MTDVLIVTGPMNASQLGVPKDADYEVIHVHPTGKDIGSTAMYKAMHAWLGGQTLFDRVRQHLGGEAPVVGKIGVAWFSAGHGAVKAILAGLTDPEDVAAWLCLDGLYGSNKWAIEVTKAAMQDKTSIMATASTSTPGHYDHSLDRWRTVVEANDIPQVPAHDATQWGLPAPDYAWGSGSCLIAGYDDLGHHKQVPAVRSAMLRWWDAVRKSDVPDVPGPKPPDPTVDDDGSYAGGWALAGAAVIYSGLFLWALKEIKR